MNAKIGSCSAEHDCLWCLLDALWLTLYLILAFKLLQHKDSKAATHTMVNFLNLTFRPYHINAKEVVKLNYSCRKVAKWRFAFFEVSCFSIKIIDIWPVSVVVCVDNTVEWVLKLHFDAHETCRAIQVRSSFVEQDGWGDFVELCDGAVEGGSDLEPGLVTYSTLFCWFFIIKDQWTKVWFLQTHTI